MERDNKPITKLPFSIDLLQVQLYSLHKKIKKKYNCVVSTHVEKKKAKYYGFA